MTTNTFGAALAVVACGALFTIAGCQSGNTAPENSPHTGGSKAPTILSTCTNIFTGIEHCTIGSSDLVGDPAAGTVVVTGFDADGRNGVSGSFADADEWSQRSVTNFGGRTGATLHFAAIADGQAVSELHIARVNAATVNFSPTFTAGDGGSSSFNVHVFKNGVLQGGQVGITPHTTIPVVNIYGDSDDDRDGGERRRKFKSNSARQANSNNQWEMPGACQWSQEAVRAGTSFSVRLPNGATVIGDKVLFTEVVGEGQAAYTNFQRVDVTGNLESYTIRDESAVPVE